MIQENCVLGIKYFFLIYNGRRNWFDLNNKKTRREKVLLGIVFLE